MKYYFMVYPYDMAKFQEHLAIMRYEKYQRDNNHEVQIKLQWAGKYPGQSQATLEAIGFQSSQEKLLKNTLGFITSNIQTLYEQALSAMLPVFGPAGVGSCTENGVVTTLMDLHKARFERDFIPKLQINLNDMKDDIAIFSFILRLKYEYEALEDGCEFVFDHDKLLFWGDGNMENHIYDYADEIRNGVNCEFL